MRTETKLRPLTETEKIMAERNHNLIYKFLHTYSYSLQDYYDIAVIGFLKAVQDYQRKESNGKQCCFSSLAWKFMQSEINNNFRMETAQKRKPGQEIISIEDGSRIRTKYTWDTAVNSAEDSVIERELIWEIMENITEMQRKIICLKAAGYNNKEIYLKLGICSSRYYAEMKQIKKIIIEK